MTRLWPLQLATHFIVPTVTVWLFQIRQPLTLTSRSFPHLQSQIEKHKLRHNICLVIPSAHGSIPLELMRPCFKLHKLECCSQHFLFSFASWGRVGSLPPYLSLTRYFSACVPFDEPLSTMKWFWSIGCKYETVDMKERIIFVSQCRKYDECPLPLSMIRKSESSSWFLASSFNR